MQSTVLGIDLGTTNSLVSVLEGGDAVLIPNGMGDVLTPSIVAVSREGEVVVGRAARELQAHTPGACRALFKRDMGTDVTWDLGGQKLSPQILSSLILQSLRRDAAEYVGEDVCRAVITVPAYFNDAQRQATKDAGELAGLQVERILAEPTAAALAYGLHVDPARRRLLVFDLGGGTFDVSVLDCEDGVLEVLASAGESQLGGEDYTQRLMAELLARRHLSLPELETSKPVLVAKFRYRIEQAKKSLTGPESAVSIPIPDFDQNQWTVAESITITGADLVDCSHSLTERFEPATWRALRDAQLGPAAIDEILLVGGASRMYLVHRFIERMFGKTPKITIDPDTVVARGAAVQGGLIAGNSAVEEIVATDVMPHTLGCNISKELGNELRSGYFMPIIHRNTTIPTSRIERLSTTSDGQKSIEIEIYQGESRMVADNLLLGKLQVDGLRPRLRGEESVTVRYTYDLNGILEVEATGDSDGKTRRLVIERRPGTLTDKQRERALRAMKSLKIELRDQDQNRFLLERGRRIYTETSPFHRDQLDYLLTEFERSLADRDPQRVDAARNELEIFLSFLADTVEDGSDEQDPGDRGPDGT